jgi:hypothetical protein
MIDTETAGGLGLAGGASLALGIVWRRFLAELDGRRADAKDYDRTINAMVESQRQQNELTRRLLEDRKQAS